MILFQNISNDQQEKAKLDKPDQPINRDHRKIAIPVEDTDEDDVGDDDAQDIQPDSPPKKKMKSTTELARESYEAYLESLERSKRLEAKMDKCMDKFLSL